jgi:hypothetical protein
MLLWLIPQLEFHKILLINLLAIPLYVVLKMSFIVIYFEEANHHTWLEHCLHPMYEQLYETSLRLIGNSQSEDPSPYMFL